VAPPRWFHRRIDDRETFSVGSSSPIELKKFLLAQPMKVGPQFLSAMSVSCPSSHYLNGKFLLKESLCLKWSESPSLAFAGDNSLSR
jgi:hypothetical protein